MQKLIGTITLLMLIGLSPSHARGGAHGANPLMAPANPSVPPSLLRTTAS